MMRLMFHAVTIAALILPAAASAQIIDDYLVRKILSRHAKCLIKSDPRGVQSVLLADPNSGQFERWRKGGRGECLVVPREGYYVNPDNTLLRFVLAEELISPTKEHIVPTDLAATPPLVHPTVSAGTAKKVPVDPRLTLLSPLGECIVRSNPASAAALLQTKPGTAAEAASKEILLRGASACTGGRDLQIDTATLRGAIALNYFRLAKGASMSRQGAAE